MEQQQLAGCAAVSRHAGTATVLCVHMEQQSVSPRTCSRERAQESRASGVGHQQCQLRVAVTAQPQEVPPDAEQGGSGWCLCQFDLTPSSGAKQTSRCVQHLPASEMGMVLHLVKVIHIF